jgi:spermidine/putrescine transport system ATP-binding protein
MSTPTNPSNPLLQVIDIHKSYDGKPLLNGTSFTLAEGEIVCLLGPSGGGKSTLLRIIAGLETQESGRVLWKDRDLEGKPPHERNFGFMFQDYALFPHRSVRQNVAFGLRMQGMPPELIEKRVADLLDKVNMAAFADRKVTDLSGGEQQRVAMARTLAPGPQLLLLDEPMGALDRTLSEQLLVELRQVLRDSGAPTIYVTHDQQEAFSIAERLLLIHNGVIIQQGPPQAVYRQPATRWVAEFLGLTNLLPGRVISSDPVSVQTEIGAFQVDPQGRDYQIGGRVTLLIRPAEMSLEPADTLPNHIHCAVKDAIFQGNAYQVDVVCASGNPMRFYLSPAYQPGAEIDLYFSDSAASCIPSDDAEIE